MQVLQRLLKFCCKLPLISSNKCKNENEAQKKEKKTPQHQTNKSGRIFATTYDLCVCVRVCMPIYLYLVVCCGIFSKWFSELHFELYGFHQQPSSFFLQFTVLKLEYWAKRISKRMKYKGICIRSLCFTFFMLAFQSDQFKKIRFMFIGWKLANCHINNAYYLFTLCTRA